MENGTINTRSNGDGNGNYEIEKQSRYIKKAMTCFLGKKGNSENLFQGTIKKTHKLE